MYTYCRKGRIMNVLRPGRCVLGSIACLLGCARGVDGNGGGPMATGSDASAGDADAGLMANESGPGAVLGDDATFPQEAGEAATSTSDASDGGKAVPTLLSQQEVCKLINDVAQVFEEPQVKTRGVRIELKHRAGANVSLVASPMRFSETPLEYRQAPPLLGEHTDEILRQFLGRSPEQIAKLRADRII